MNHGTRRESAAHESDIFQGECNPNGLKKIPLKHFEMHVTSRCHDQYGMNTHGPFSSAIINNYLKPHSTFVDVGAHHGYYSLLAYHSQEDIKIIAIEPDEENFEILKSNITLNKIENDALYNFAASDTNEVRDFYISQASDKSGFYKDPLTPIKKIIKIKTRRLDEILQNEKVDFVKISAGGHEIPILCGLSQAINNNKDIVLLGEFNPLCLKNAGFKPGDFFEKIYEFGFEAFLIDEINRKYYRLDSGGDSWRRVMGKALFAKVLCIKRNKSLFISYFSHTAQLGGAEKTLIDLLTQIKEYGAIGHVVFPEDGPLVEMIKETALSYDIIKYNWWIEGKTTSDRTSFINTIRFLRTLNKINPHLLLTNTIVFPWGAFSAFFLNKPHVWYVHEFGEKDHGFVFATGFKWMAKIMDLLSNKIIYNAKAVQSLFEQYIDKTKGITIYYTIKMPEDYTNKGVEEIYKVKDSLKLIMLANFVESKGHAQAVHAVIDLIKEGHNVELLMIGCFSENSSYFRFLNALIEESHVEGIYFKNFVENPYVYLHQADVVLLCSRCEAFSRTPIEGMMLKKPSIGADTGGTRELIKEGYNGFLYTYNDIESLKEKIRFFINHSDQIKTMGENGFNYIKGNFSTEKYAGAIFDLCIGLKNKKSNFFLQLKKFLILQIIFINIVMQKRTLRSFKNYLTHCARSIAKKMSFQVLY